MTNIEQAKALLNDPETKAAWLQWSRKPMETSDKDFKKAMDWCEAVLCVSSRGMGSIKPFF